MSQLKQADQQQLDKRLICSLSQCILGDGQELESGCLRDTAGRSFVDLKGNETRGAR